MDTISFSFFFFFLANTLKSHRFDFSLKVKIQFSNSFLVIINAIRCGDYIGKNVSVYCREMLLTICQWRREDRKNPPPNTSLFRPSSRYHDKNKTSLENLELNFSNGNYRLLSRSDSSVHGPIKKLATFCFLTVCLVIINRHSQIYGISEIRYIYITHN